MTDFDDIDPETADDRTFLAIVFHDLRARMIDDGDAEEAIAARLCPGDVRVAVTPGELERAFLVWLRVMPKSIWREVEKAEAAMKEKRGDGREMADPMVSLASYLAGKFRDAKWKVGRPEAEHLGSPPPFQG